MFNVAIDLLIIFGLQTYENVWLILHGAEMNACIIRYLSSVNRHSFRNYHPFHVLKWVFLHLGVVFPQISVVIMEVAIFIWFQGYLPQLEQRIHSSLWWHFILRSKGNCNRKWMTSLGADFRDWLIDPRCITWKLWVVQITPNL